MVRTGVTAQDLALCCGVDPKTIERWISPGRVPHRTHRWAAARRLGYEESYLWPEIRRSPARRAEAACSELVCLYPDRASVPRGVWLRLMTSAAEGIEVRLCFGDPASDAVATRDREEGLGGTLAAKIRSALTYYRPLATVDGCQLRLHATTLYASLFRYDEEIMVNPHAYGEPASANPMLHLRRLDGGQIAGHYMACFDRVWDTAKPWYGEEV